MIPVGALALAYVILQRRRQRYAVRFAALPMLDKVVPRRPGWRRHLPATLIVVALTCLGLAAARPELTLRVPYDRATIMVAIDTSGSMAAPDVPPTRLEAAKAAAAAFVEQLPDTVNVGVVSFAGASAVVDPPSTDHDQVQQQVPGATIAYGTADGIMPNARGGSRVPVDTETLAQLADATGGTAYTAETGEELRDVYADIGSSIGWRTEQREVTPYLAALALLVGVGAGALSLRWFSRLI